MRVKNNLLTLGSAAVIAVYAAGYARTSEAAHRFDEGDGAERRRPAPVPNIGVVGEATPTPERRDSAPAPTRSVASAPAKQKADVSVPVQTSASVATAEPARVPDSAATKTPAVPASTAPDSASRVAQAASDSAAQADRGPFKDGTFYGWGTSRHGDIQAGVEIRNGKIYDSWIEQCLTRYSCSWISRLPGQVVARQSPEVDYVSGATQSTNAFYYAVSQAITRAK